MTEIISGVFAAVVIMIVSRILSGYFTFRLIAATILVAIAYIYVGFSLKGGSIIIIVIELVAAFVFYFIAIIGYTKNKQLIGYGIILHGLWDILHHNSSYLTTNIPAYWPSFCFIIDLLDGGFFLYILKERKPATPVR